jgi:hypothetical protein
MSQAKVLCHFLLGFRPHTCLECTFYQPINQKLFEERAKGN